MSFDRALAFTLKWEGGYANDPLDKGGETNKGITKAVYDKYRTDRGLPIRSVKIVSWVEIKDIYKLLYWDKCKCDSLPWPLSICVFDLAVNSGCKRAIELLQEVLGDDIIIDGLIGPKTLAAVKLQNSFLLASALCDRREQFYQGIVKHNPSQERFLKGWLTRLSALKGEFQ
jgi:lysozyme family protein